MVGIPCFDGAASDDDDAKIEGPVIRRKYTDCHCLLACFAYIAAHAALATELHKHGDPTSLTHGHDYLGRACGLDAGVETLPYAYYPDLERDFATRKGYLADTYGLCVGACPKPWTVLSDYPHNTTGLQRKERWYVAWPSLPLLGRCFPFQDRRTRDKGLMCAWPPCDKTLACKGPDDVVCHARKLCGGNDDGEDTSKFWYLERPKHADSSLPTSGVGNVVSDRPDPLLQELLDACEVKIHRHFALSVVDDHGVFAKMVTRYSGHVFTAAGEIQRNWTAIILIGLVGSLCWSMLLVRGFAACLRIVMVIFVLLLFVGLCLLDYILFVRAGKISAHFGLDAYKFLVDEFSAIPGADIDLGSSGDELLRSFGAAEDPKVQGLYGYAALILLIAIGVLACMWLKCQKNMNVIIALASEAARVLWRMPSLVVFPFIIILSLSAWCCGFLYMCLYILTLRGSALQSDVDDLQASLLCLVAFSFLWAWFFHMALTTTTVAGAVSQWFFFRQDSDADKEHSRVLSAFVRALRYHLGSMALGSFLIAVTKLPRMILMHVQHEIQHTHGNNGALTCVMRIFDCCLWCFERFLKAIAGQAYVHIAITGKSFCPSAHASMVLVAKWPMQMWFNAIATEAIHWIVVLLVPTLNMLLSMVIVKRSQYVCAPFIALLSCSVASIAVSVFDTSLSTLFMCAVRDEEYHHGKYSPESLRAALELPERKAKARSAGIEMSGREMDLGE
mmetsp:Transcript_118352/g.339683  ORF Transcript_118352/g.339683 Transcript_118352/m.339683 type:complete len:731 (-) Transcript_118352:216-2408(-)